MAELDDEITKGRKPDFRYQPLVKAQIDAMCLPKNAKERGIFIGILDNYINEKNITDKGNTPNDEVGDVGGSIL